MVENKTKKTPFPIQTFPYFTMSKLSLILTFLLMNVASKIYPLLSIKQIERVTFNF